VPHNQSLSANNVGDHFSNAGRATITADSPHQPKVWEGLLADNVDIPDAWANMSVDKK